MDPFERADVVSDVYYDWMTKNAYLAAYGVKHSAEFLQTFIDYPPSQIPDSFSIDQIEERIDAANRAKAAAQKK
jgi:arylsulfatase